jgi:hypothetical protein
LAFFGEPGEGLVSRALSEILVSVDSRFIPTLSWLVDFAATIGLDERRTLVAIWLLLLTSGCLLVAGLWPRFAAIAAWFLHLCAAKSGTFVSYGVDNFMTIGLFYLMLAPQPDRWALAWRFSQPKAPDPVMLGFFRRVLQLHLCVIYFFGGLTKALGSGWWDGSNIWRALTRPPFDLIPPQTVLFFEHFLPALGISVWIIELAYPLFIWPQKTRRLWLVLTCALHLGIALAMGMYLFALVMIVLNIAAFGPRNRAWNDSVVVQEAAVVG